MQRSTIIGLVAVLSATLGAGPVSAQQYRSLPYRQGPMTPPMVEVAKPQRMATNLGGGFIEFLFGGDDDRAPRYAEQPPQYAAPPQVAPPQVPPPHYAAPQRSQPVYANNGPIIDPAFAPEPGPAPRSFPIDPRYQRQEVRYDSTEPPGSIVIDTPHKFLYLVEADGKALRYGIGVGRPGFMWSGVHKVSAKKEWPDWVPPKEMLERQPNLPHFMAGGPNNPLGARAMYLGSTLYRIHGSNEPWTIGHNVSSGCIRLRNADVIDLYGRVKVGAKVVVM
jgi:lipoprotein-anchoring transpeptidase ErfK/SrfK